MGEGKPRPPRPCRGSDRREGNGGSAGRRNGGLVERRWRAGRGRRRRGAGKELGARWTAAAGRGGAAENLGERRARVQVPPLNGEGGAAF